MLVKPRGESVQWPDPAENSAIKEKKIYLFH